MDILFLGTGTSHGIPMIACDCAVCRSADPRNQRGRTSIHVVMGGLHIQVDLAAEFRLQCVRERIERVDLVVVTHEHADHVGGMDDLRRFCALQGNIALPVYGSTPTLRRVTEMFPYALRERPDPKGYAAFQLRTMPPVLSLPGGTIEATPLPHGEVETLGLIFRETGSGRKFAYYTDCKVVPEAAVALARGADAVVLDGLRPRPHPTHQTIEEAVAVAARIGARQTLITHLTHDSDHAELAGRLPPGVAPAYDGLRLHL